MRMKVLMSPLPTLSSTYDLGAEWLMLVACCPGGVENLSNSRIAPARAGKWLCEGLYHLTTLVAYLYTCAPVHELVGDAQLFFRLLCGHILLHRL
jgi:hypothetical protein